MCTIRRRSSLVQMLRPANPRCDRVNRSPDEDLVAKPELQSIHAGERLRLHVETRRDGQRCDPISLLTFQVPDSCCMRKEWLNGCRQLPTERDTYKDVSLKTRFKRYTSGRLSGGIVYDHRIPCRTVTSRCETS